MNNQTKIVIAGALPVLILLFIIGSVLLPRLFFTPKYDFIYTIESGCNYYCNGWVPYSLADASPNTFGVLKKNPLPTPPVDVKTADPHYPKLYLYQAASDTFSEISFERANSLGKLTGDGSAPDGTSVSNNYGGHGGLFGELFGGGYRYNYNSLYLKNGTWNKEITIRNSASPNTYYDYANGFRLISWVEYLRL
ncbi:MAG: hypothetical protein AAB391_00685 [Patescibacteria group bacterium]